jgi:hypothetical protein
MSGYMKFAGRTLVEVRCKRCPAVLTARINGGLKNTPHYAELVIAMRLPNGLFGKHETGMCKACKQRIVHDGPQPGELEAIYAEDMAVMIDNAVQLGGVSLPTALKMAEEFISWQPLRALDEKGRGEE